MICERCGTTSLDTATLCPVCGTMFSSQQYDTALAIEILLSLFGIYGVGWLLSGKKITGVILLICSVFLYWPLMILGTILTLGIGLLCLGPLAIVSIIINAMLLDGCIRRRTAHVAFRQHAQQRASTHSRL